MKICIIVLLDKFQNLEKVNIILFSDTSYIAKLIFKSICEFIIQNIGFIWMGRKERRPERERS